MSCRIVCSDSEIECERRFLVKHSVMLFNEFRKECSCNPVMIVSKDYVGKTVTLMLLILEGRADIRGLGEEAMSVLACMEKFGISWNVEEECEKFPTIDPVTGEIQVGKPSINIFTAFQLLNLLPSEDLLLFPFNPTQTLTVSVLTL